MSLEKPTKTYAAIYVPSETNNRVIEIGRHIGLRRAATYALLVEAWHVLTNEQRTQALERFIGRNGNVLAPVS